MSEATQLFHREGTNFSSSYKEVKLKSAPKGSKPKNEIFEAITQLVKYVSYEIGDYLDLYKERKMEANSCIIFFPVIVFDGEMYSAELDKGNLVIKPTKYIFCIIHYKPKYESRRAPFLIEVVSRKYFPKYISLVENRIKKLNKKIEKMTDIKQSLIDALSRSPYG